MNVLHVPWLDLAIALALIGSPIVSRLRNPNQVNRWVVWFTGLAFFCTSMAWLAYYLGATTEEVLRYSVQPRLFGRPVFYLDELNAPIVPAISLLHFLTALATARTKMRRFSSSWSLTAEFLRICTFTCSIPWVLIGFLCVSTIPPLFELTNRGRSKRVYMIHMGAFIALLVLGWTAVEMSGGDSTIVPWWASLPLLLAVLVRCGTVPAHVWLTDWFEHASFGTALLFVTPLSGVYLAVRLVLPISPDWVLHSIGLFSLVTAVYAAGMATIQKEERRFFANLFLSQASLVLVGVEIHTELSLTASFCLWFSAILSLGGFGLTLRALESRFGRLSLTEYHGLYEHSPALAVCFMLTGLATVGFPGTLGFISTELLVDSAVEENPIVGICVITAAALNGIAMIRAYFRLFTGTRHQSTVSLRLGARERVAVLTLSALILGGGLLPQPGVNTRQRAAEQALGEHNRRAGKPAPSHEQRQNHNETAMQKR